MSESIYRERMLDIKAKQKMLSLKIEKIESAPTIGLTIDPKALAEGAAQILGKLSFDEKKAVVRSLVSKVTATQEKVIICGQIPVTTDTKVGLRANDRNRGNATIPNSDGKVGLGANNRHCQLATIPSELAFPMPELNKRTRGYLPELIKELQDTVGGER